MTFWCCIPGALGWFSSVILLDESARFELLNNNVEEAILIMEKMNRENKGAAIFDEENKIKLLNWTHAMNRVARN